MLPWHVVHVAGPEVLVLGTNASFSDPWRSLLASTVVDKLDLNRSTPSPSTASFGTLLLRVKVIECPSGYRGALQGILPLLVYPTGRYRAALPGESVAGTAKRGTPVDAWRARGTVLWTGGRRRELELRITRILKEPPESGTSSNSSLGVPRKVLLISSSKWFFSSNWFFYGSSN